MKGIEMSRSSYDYYKAWQKTDAEGCNWIYIDLDTMGHKLRLLYVTHDNYRFMS
jgi:hypothetical protein